MGAYSQDNGVIGTESHQNDGEVRPSNGVNGTAGAEEDCNGVDQVNGVDGVNGVNGVNGHHTDGEPARRKRVVVVGLGMVGIAFMFVVANSPR